MPYGSRLPSKHQAWPGVVAPPAPPAASASLGWASTVTVDVTGDLPQVDGAVAHANAGRTTAEKITWSINYLFAGVVGYTSGVVSWVLVWTSGVATADQPVLTNIAGGRVEVAFPGLTAAANGLQAGAGILSASVDGQPAIDTLSFDYSYAPDYPFNPYINWGPVLPVAPP